MPVQLVVGATGLSAVVEAVGVLPKIPQLLLLGLAEMAGLEWS
jgi:hypothetical protein